MAPTAPPRFRLHALGGAGLVLATLSLSLFAVAASACSPTVAGVSPTACARSTPLVVNTDASASASPPSVTGLPADATASPSPHAPPHRLAPPPSETRATPASATSSPRTRSTDMRRPPSATVRDAPPVRSSATPAAWAPSSPRTRSGSSSGIVMVVGSAATSTIDAEARRARSEAVESPRRGCSASASPGCSTTSTLDAGAPRARSAESTRASASPASAPSATPASAPSSPRTRSGSSSLNATVDAEAHRARSESVETMRCGRSASASPGTATTTPSTTSSASSPGRSASAPSGTLGTEARPARSEAVETIPDLGYGPSLGAASTIPTPTSSASSPGRMFLMLAVVAAILAAAGGGWAARGGGEQQRVATDDRCELCFVKKAVFVIECCDVAVCNLCLHDFMREGHDGSCKRPAARRIVPLLHPRHFDIGDDLPEGYEHQQPQFPPWYFVKSIKKNSRLHLFYCHLLELEAGSDPRATEVIHLVYPRGELSAAIVCDIHPRMRTFSEL